MATLRQVLVGRPWWHSPVFWIAIAALVVLAAGMVTANYTVWDNPTVPSLPSLGQANQPVAQPVQQAPQQNVAVAPAIPLVEVQWVEIGTARNGKEVLALPISWDRVVQEARPDDKVTDWLKRVNLTCPSGINNTCPFGHLLEGNKVILYAFTASSRQTPQDPHLLSYWKAEVPLSEIEGLSP